MSDDVPRRFFDKAERDRQRELRRIQQRRARSIAYWNNPVACGGERDDDPSCLALWNPELIVPCRGRRRVYAHQLHDAAPRQARPPGGKANARWNFSVPEI